MTLPTQITFRHMDPSPALTEEIHRRVDSLRLARVVACRVVVEAPTDHHRKGGEFHVRIELDSEHGKTFTAGGRGDAHANTDAYLAVRQAFEGIRRQLVEAHHGHGRPDGREGGLRGDSQR